MSCVAIAESWLRSTLKTALGDLPVEPYPRPKSLAGKTCCVFKFMASNDVNRSGGRRWTEIVYQVALVAPGTNVGPLVDGYKTADAALQAKSAITPRGRIISCIRQSEVSFPETDDDQQTVNQVLGGIYRLLVRP